MGLEIQAVVIKCFHPEKKESYFIFSKQGNFVNFKETHRSTILLWVQKEKKTGNRWTVETCALVWKDSVILPCRILLLKIFQQLPIALKIKYKLFNWPFGCQLPSVLSFNLPCPIKLSRNNELIVLCFLLIFPIGFICWDYPALTSLPSVSFGNSSSIMIPTSSRPQPLGLVYGCGSSSALH